MRNNFLKTHFIYILGFLFLTSCMNHDDNVQKELNYPLRSEISTLDPANSYDTVSSSVIYQSHEQLYQYHYLKRPYTIIPLLAESLPKISNKGLTYTIKIKKNIRYHDHPIFKGKVRYLKSQDFVTQIKRLAYIPTRSSGWWLFKNRIIGINHFRKYVGNDFQKLLSTPIEGIQTPDDYTLIINLTAPYPQMLYALSMSFSSPTPVELIVKYKNDLHDIMIGTGPYKLEKWYSATSLKLIKFKHYRKVLYPTQGDRSANGNGLLKDSGKKIPFIDKINFHVIKESNTRWLNFINSKLDFLIIPKDNYNSSITAEGQLNKELTDKKIRLQIFPTLTYWWVAFNMQDQHLGKNLLLRKAIAHAIDIDKYIKVFTNNIGQKANSIYPPGVPGYDPSNQLPYSYNLDKAKLYLKEAGYPNGKGLPSFNYDVRGISATNRHMANFIKGELSKIGVKIKINLNTFPSFLEKARRKKLQIWQGGWAMDYPDIENTLQLLHSKNWSPGPNATLYSNKEFDKLLDQISTITDIHEKQGLAKKMENIVNNTLPWIMQYYTRNYILVQDRLKNHRHSDIIFNNVKYLNLN